MTARRPAYWGSARTASFGGRDLVLYGLVAGAVWLGWAIVKIPVVQRAPPEIAMRLDGGSPNALRRAAEAEFVAGRIKNAEALAADALTRAPFNVRALRVLGLSKARGGDEAEANDLITLAGNWSLRDDAAHAWLMEYRLRQGRFPSAFAHADTLARRRVALHPQLFQLFTLAATESPDALGFLNRQLAANPPWRRAYIEYLRRSGSDAVLLSVAVALERSPTPLGNDEIQRIAGEWMREHRYEAVRLLRQNMAREGLAGSVSNGDFEQSIENWGPPFGWDIGRGRGRSVEITRDDISPENTAARIVDEGRSIDAALSQVLALPPGPHVAALRQRLERGAEGNSLVWSVRCLGLEQNLGQPEGAMDTSAGTTWRPVRMSFVVPATNCPLQRLSLAPRLADRGATSTVWVDDVVVRPAAGSTAENGSME